MTRVSTAGGWNSALLNLMDAQQRQNDAQTQVSTQKIATDLKGFGRGAETLAAFKTAASRLDGFIQGGQAVSQRLTTQDSAMNETADAAQAARQAITDALASGRGDSLMLELQQQFQTAVDGLNAQHQGRYLFGGGRSDQPPVTATSLSDLTAGPPISSLFKNDQQKAGSRLDDATTVTTGFLASDMGTSLFAAFQTVQAFSQTPAGNFSGTLTQTQRDFLEAQLATFDSAHSDLVNYAAQNGSLQKRVEAHVKGQQAQADSLTTLIGQRTDVDMATALTQLQQAQQAVQASAQVLASLKNSSLLNLLSAGV